MKPGRSILGAGESLLDRVLCAAGAVIFSQFPEFMQQYMQRLGGHLDEARRQLQQFEHAATQSGLTVAKLAGQTTANSDPAVARLGGVMKEAIARVDTLSAAQAAVDHASIWSRPFVFLKHADPTIARATWGVFKPAVPTTFEGLVYALLGMVIVMILYHLGIKYPLTRKKAEPKPRYREPEAYIEPPRPVAPSRPAVVQDTTGWQAPPRQGPSSNPPSLKK